MPHHPVTKLVGFAAVGLWTLAALTVSGEAVITSSTEDSQAQEDTTIPRVGNPPVVDDLKNAAPPNPLSALAVGLSAPICASSID